MTGVIWVVATSWVTQPEKWMFKTENSHGGDIFVSVCNIFSVKKCVGYFEN